MYKAEEWHQASRYNISMIQVSSSSLLPTRIRMNFRSCMIFLSSFLDFVRIPILTDSSLARLNSGILYLLNSSVKQTVLARFLLFFTCDFLIYKKDTCKPKNFYPYPQTSPWHPFILKIIIFEITLKKYT